MFERCLDDAYRVARSEDGPIRFEVTALESGAADLLGEEAVLNRVVDVFEELSVDLLVDRAQSAVRIDLKDGYPPVLLQVVAHQRQRRANCRLEGAARLTAPDIEWLSKQRTNAGAL